MSAADPRGSESKRNGRAWVLAGIGSFVALLLFAYYVFSLAFTESLYTTRGSFAYHLLVPEVIQDVPLIEVVGEERFHTSAGDGPKPPSSSIEYQSRAGAAAIRLAIESFLESRGFTKRGSLEELHGDRPATLGFHEAGTTFYRPGHRSGDGSATEDRPGPEITLSVSSGEGGTLWVVVTQVN